MDSAQIIDMPHDGYDEATETAPHSLEAEQAVLGCLLYDNAQLERISSFLTADDFYGAHHATIYAGMVDRIGRGELADAIVMRARLLKDGSFIGLDAADYLAQLLANAPPPATVVEYAKLVADAALRRKGLTAADTMTAALLDMNGPPVKTALTAAGEALGELALKGVGQNAFLNPVDVAADLLDAKAPEQIGTGLPSLDRLAMLDRQALTLLAGHTSMGKSAVAMEFARRIAANGYRVRLFSLEMNEWQVTARLLSATIAEGQNPRHVKGVPYFRIAKPRLLSDWQREAVQAASVGLPPVMVDATHGLAVSDMIARLNEEPEAPDLVIVDYVNIVGLSDMPKGLRHDQMIGEVASRLRGYAKRRNCAVVLLCQLNRNSATRDEKAPELSDLKDSSALEQAADTVLFAHRPEYFLQRKADRITASNETIDDELKADLAASRNKLFIICAKQRMGPTGQAELLCDIQHNYIAEGG